MATQKNAFLIGLFVILGSAIFIAALIWLGASNWFAKTMIYASYFDYTVQGLTMDAEVKFRGVRVGRVKEIGVAPDGNLIEVIMELDLALDVSDSMRAKVELAGITGMKYIELDFVGPEKQLLHPKLNFKPIYPVIPSYPGGFEEIEQALRDIYDKIISIDTEGISFNTKRFLTTATDAAGTLDSLLADEGFTAWTRRLDNNLVKVDSMLSELNMDEYDAEMMNTLAELRKGARHFNDFFQSLEQQAEGMRADVKLDSIYYNLNIMLYATTEMMRNFHYQSTEVLTSINTVVIALNETLAQMNAMLMSMDMYPASIFYSAPPPKEK